MQGEVSILAHSLGSVLCYDILCNQPHLHKSLRDKQDKAESKSETALASFGSMQPMQSSDLDPSKILQVGDCFFIQVFSTHRVIRYFFPRPSDDQGLLAFEEYLIHVAWQL